MSSADFPFSQEEEDILNWLRREMHRNPAALAAYMRYQKGGDFDEMIAEAIRLKSKEAS